MSIHDELRAVEDARRLDEAIGGSAVRAAMQMANRLEEASGGALARALEDEARLVNAITGGTLAQRLEEDVRRAEVISGGPVARLAEKTARHAEMMSAVPLARMIEATTRRTEMMSGGALTRTLGETARHAEMMSGGPVARMMEETARHAEMMSGGPLARVMEETARRAEMMSGGPFARTMESVKLPGIEAFRTALDAVRLPGLDALNSAVAGVGENSLAAIVEASRMPGLDALRSISTSTAAWQSLYGLARNQFGQLTSHAIDEMELAGVGRFEQISIVDAVEAAATNPGDHSIEQETESLLEYGFRLAAAIAEKVPSLDAAHAFQYIVYPLLVSLICVGISYALSNRDNARAEERIEASIAEVKSAVAKRDAPRHYVAARRLLMRDAPNKLGRVLATYLAGTEFVEQDRGENGWRYVETFDSSPAGAGWVYYGNLTPSAVAKRQTKR